VRCVRDRSVDFSASRQDAKEEAHGDDSKRGSRCFHGDGLQTRAQENPLARAGTCAHAVSAILCSFEDFVYLRVTNRLARFVREKILLRNVGDVLSLSVFRKEMIERLILGWTDFRGDREPPFFSIGENRIDVINNAAEWVNAVLDDLADAKFGDASFHAATEPARLTNINAAFAQRS
jgi:hypothetical protein